MDPNLYLAAMKGDLVFLRTFQETSNNLESQLTPSQDTVLHVATEFHQAEFATAAANDCPPLLWQVNSSGDTALHIAARERHADLVTQFIACARNADEGTGESKHLEELVRSVNLKKDTALHCAARSGCFKSVRRLAKADPEVCSFVNSADESPIYVGIASQFWGIHQHIIKYAPSSALYKGPRGLTALHQILTFNICPLEEIEILVKWRPEMIREGDDLGMIPLHYAALRGKIDAIKLFIQYDSSAIYLLTNNGESALHIAAFQGYSNALKELINCRPDCYNLIDNKGRTPLHAAVLGKRRATVEFILKTPPLERLINKQDCDGNTTLHLAALHKFYDAIEVITNHKIATWQIANNEFSTPFDVYKKHDQEGLKAAVACYNLKNFKGPLAVQQYASGKLEKMNKEAENAREEETSTNNKLKLDKSSDFGLESALEVNLLVAMLVATVTFAAGFTVPGGFISSGEQEGLAILTKKPSFVVFTVPGGFIARHEEARVRYIGIAADSTTVAILAMVLAFCSGTYVVLTKSTPLSVTPYIMTAFFMVLYFALLVADPGVDGLPCLCGFQRFIRGIVIRHVRC
ncbi:ankyrin repeat-containing protein At5g02620-like [Momordica charantia]|uniref:Ankyrin repeat-containing protein At5g02620-like n=1 Tax=Momordica charantia TaxID=3673 RepID=A0A6J1CN22_MOMCH|nr:ankyrin repeat-containing protein At5g02620-like [Momordica charantia]